MILTKDVKIKYSDKLSSEYIESELKKIGIVPLKWAISSCDNKFFNVIVSFEKI